MFHWLISDTTGSPVSIYDLITRGGVPALLFVVLYGSYKRWWVWGWQVKDLEERMETLRGEKNEWKEIALHSTNLAESLDKLRKEGITP